MYDGRETLRDNRIASAFHAGAQPSLPICHIDYDPLIPSCSLPRPPEFYVHRQSSI